MALEMVGLVAVHSDGRQLLSGCLVRDPAAERGPLLVTEAMVEKFCEDWERSSELRFLRYSPDPNAPDLMPEPADDSGCWIRRFNLPIELPPLWQPPKAASADAPPDPIFRVVGPDGHEFRIHEDGRTEGFPEGSWIVNRIPLRIALSQNTPVEAGQIERMANDASAIVGAAKALRSEIHEMAANYSSRRG